MLVTNSKELTERIRQLREAQKLFATYTQEEVDEIFRQAAMAANNARIKLAKMTVEETGMGIVEDKVIKNHFAAEYIYNKYKDMKTCGIIEKDNTFGITKVAELAYELRKSGIDINTEILTIDEMVNKLCQLK